jgi:hypothetical protein
MEMTGSRNRRGRPHRHFFGGGRVVSHAFAKGVVRAVDAAATAATALRMSAVVFSVLASGLGGLSGVILANAARATALLAACKLNSSVFLTKA